jgi:hypothetical protein
MWYPKILIISNNCFSLSSNNGRTLGNFFIGWPQAHLAQFYIKSEEPDKSICSNYLCISDHRVFEMLVRSKRSADIFRKQQVEINEQTNNIKKNSFTMIIRYALWSIAPWKSELFNFIEKFTPDLILLQAGDTPMMYDITRIISKQKNIPIVMYNSEDHVLRSKDYFGNNNLSCLFFPIFIYLLRKSFRKTLNQTSHVIYISEKLQTTYQKLLCHESSVIYTSSDVNRCESPVEHSPLIVSYFGNLEFNRYISLIELANVFNKVDPRIIIDVYGKVSPGEMMNKLENCSTIRLKGFVHYDVIKQVMKDSDILLHVESFDGYYCHFNTHYFSTKIADCLASGRTFVVYAPSKIAFVEYLGANDAAIIISNKNELESTVKLITESLEFRMSKISNALFTADKNHNIDKNRERFQRILIKMIKNEN